MPLWRCAVSCRSKPRRTNDLFDPTAVFGLSGLDGGRREAGRAISYNLRVTHESAEWLLMYYPEAEAVVCSIGIVLYVPGTDTLYTRFRNDYSFVLGKDREILDATGELILR